MSGRQREEKERGSASSNSSTSGSSFTSTTNSTKHEGPLSKWTNVMRGWQYRWFVLDPVHCTLEYYLTEDDRVSGSPRASIKLHGASVAPNHEDTLTFVLNTSHGEGYKLKAHDTKDRQKWVNLLRCVISNTSNQQREQTATAQTTKGASNAACYPLNTESRRDSLTRMSSVGGSSRGASHFSNEPATMRYDEPFGPARQVISKVREKRNEMCRLIEVGGDSDAVVATQALHPDLLMLKSNSLAAWDCLHQCVFALMNTETGSETGDVVPAVAALAAVGAFDPPSSAYPTQAPVEPYNSIQNTFTQVNEQTLDRHERPRRERSPSPAASSLTHFQPEANSLTQFQPPLVSVLGKTPAAPGQTPAPRVGPDVGMIASPNRATIPVNSAQLQNNGAAAGGGGGGSLGSLPRDGDRNTGAAMVTSVPAGSTRGSPAPASPEKSRSPSRFPYYFQDEEEMTDVDEDDAEELGSIESEKSVILHLIGQLKIGMDLTKVTLPTFILERRSLLEMFADYLGHAYILLRIADMETPEQRILGVLEWYLTSLHIVRKGTQAKKPYNPIIGETFHCSYKVPNEGEKNGEQLRVKFVGEQVSHHPPVTAFYAECPEKKICMSASIYTQSKFYGLSIGVNLVGTASLFLVEFGEEYTFTLPSAYARSILTVPWCELGGKVALQCKKTGYSAEIIFHTKPFYGGKLHRVTAEVFSEKSKNPVCKVNGEWNSNYDFTMTQDGTLKHIDVNTLQVIKKRVRPIDKQDPFESRRLWKNVTAALKVQDITKATAEKNALEDAQRKGEKERKANATGYPTKFFHLEESGWTFNEPLNQ
ncbi:hypothetical protein RvY_09591 [Ramazzottius varieornatus]|uniref:Oxysterol-binding protein n=1 Tax=Ramazzottius varieornatus TaxID=947166 RepID=A0A1D1V9Y0_RAMVA|nr:hypothetical protein RvY_09591 [Ramazzottius varieornatus]